MLSIASTLAAWLLLANPLTTANAQKRSPPGRGHFRGGNQNKVKTGMEKFKEDHLILPSAVLQKQQISIDGTIRANGRAYSLKNLEPYNVYSRNAIIVLDGLPRPLEDSSHRKRMFKGKGENGEVILVSKEGFFDEDNGGDIKSVTIINQDGSEVLMEALSDGSLVLIRPEDMDTEKLRSFDFGEGIAGDIINSPLFDQNNRNLQQGCTSFKVVEVAAAYDSTFCAQVASDSDSTARSVIEAAIARADALFEPICVRVRLSYLEGYCSSAQDPYTSAASADNIGCDGTRGSLQIFRDLWEDSRRDVDRDTAHFFVGKDFPGSTIGCAATPALCNSDSYGVNQFSFSDNALLQGNLFAHELGHNMGALHMDDPSDTASFLMEPGLNSASDGVSSQSSTSILEYLDSRNCISTENVGDDAGDTPPEDDTGDGGDTPKDDTEEDDTEDDTGDPPPKDDNDTPTSSFMLENSKHRGNCITVLVLDGSNQQVHLAPCDDANPAQDWSWNEQTHWLESSSNSMSMVGNKKCLATSTVANGALLSLQDCNNNTSSLLEYHYYTQWSFNNDQTLQLDHANNKCLDVSNQGRFPTTLQLGQCNRARDKRWLIR